MVAETLGATPVARGRADSSIRAHSAGPRARYPPGVPAPSAPGPVQIFGREDSRETRAALRFFRERRIEVQLIDLRRKPMAPAELRRFIERLGPGALADTDGRAWRDAGLGYLSMTDA